MHRLQDYQRSEHGEDQMSASEEGTSTTSFTSSLADVWFREEHGRPVQNSNDAYQWPADERHLRDEELWTEWKTMFLGKETSSRGLYPSQVAERVEQLLSKKGSRFLDVGCGRKADWLCGMGERFPIAEGRGVDTQPIYTEFLPPNICGELYDCSRDLPYPDDFFDIITHAYLCPFLSEDFTYETLVSEIARCLKPGGVYFCLDKHTTGPGLDDGRPLQREFPFKEAFLRKSAFWGIRPSTSKPSKLSFRFRPVVLATKAFEMVEEQVIASQVGNRNADPQADLLGEISWRIFYHVFSHASWFLLRAGFSDEDSVRWEVGIVAELETLRLCENGKGGFAQLHLVYAVTKEDGMRG